MATQKEHDIRLTYTGGGLTINRNIAVTGESELNFAADCGNGTTSFNPPIVMDPDNRIQCLCYSAVGGNVTLKFTKNDGTSGGTIGLTDSSPTIDVYDPSTDLIRYVPTSADTYSLSILNASTVSVAVNLLHILQ